MSDDQAAGSEVMSSARLAQFQEEMARRVTANPGRDIILGCPLCGAVAKQAPTTQNQQ